MERLITVRDICRRYGCTTATARKYIRQMIPHMEKPLTAPESAFRAWEDRRTVIPVPKGRRQEILYKQSRVIVPRERG